MVTMMTTAERYRWHAETEFRGQSDVYYGWASSISEDAEVLAMIERLPEVKRRAPLLFAAMRFRGAPVGPYANVRPWLIDAWREVEQAAQVRFQQTNEAGRCATLLPVLSTIEGPVALLEVGAAAGACLFPDRYEYEYVTPDGNSVGLRRTGQSSGVRLRCEIASAESIPTRLPEVVWRCGIDLNPLSFANPDDVDWLRTLVWPEHTERRQRLERVADVLRASPPRIDRGDALDLVPQLAREAPSGATLVIFHTAVLAYFSAEDRDRFMAMVAGLGATWLSNEGPGAVPSIAARIDPAVEIGPRFILARDGEPVALTGAHGQSYSAV